MADFEESLELLGEEEAMNDANEHIDSKKQHQADSFEADSKDPLLATIGEFGLYQFYVCLVGFFFHIPHTWCSLSLKFVGMKTNFTCADVGSSNSSCFGSNGAACQNFVYDQSQFRSTIIERWDLVCDREGLDSISQSVFFAGCLFGVFIAGVLADSFGRKPVLMTLIITFTISGVLGGITHSFYIWLALRFILGAASIGMSSVRFTIQVEIVGSKYRTWGNMLGGLGWSVAYMLLPAMAYIIPDMSHLEIVIGLCGLPFLSLYWLYPESPKWLLSVGRNWEAEDVIKRVCHWNGKKISRIEFTFETG